jgi:hypothetical protein
LSAAPILGPNLLDRLITRGFVPASASQVVDDGGVTEQRYFCAAG